MFKKAQPEQPQSSSPSSLLHFIISPNPKLRHLFCLLVYIYYHPLLKKSGPSDLRSQCLYSRRFAVWQHILL